MNCLFNKITITCIFRKSCFLSILIIVLSYNICIGQTRNFWLIESSNAFKFDSPNVKVIPFTWYGNINTAICDSLGTLIFYNSLDTIYNGNNIPLANGKTIRGFTKSICINYNSQKYALIAQGPNLSSDLTYNQSSVYIYNIDMSYNNGQGKVETIDSSFSGRYIFHDVIYNTLIKQYLFTFTNQVKTGDLRKLYLAKLNNVNKIELTDSMSTNDTDKTHNLSGAVFFNNNANSIIFPKFDSTYYHYEKLNIAELDIFALHFKPGFKQTPTFKYKDIGAGIFSPNDSFIFGTYKTSTFLWGIFQYNIKTDQVFYTDSNYLRSRNIKYPSFFWLLPDGKIYMTESLSGTKPLNAVMRILDPDLPLDTNKIDNGVVNLINTFIVGGLMYEHFTIQRVKFKCSLTCTGIELFNRSDSGLFDKFILYINNDSFIQPFPHINRWNQTPFSINLKQLGYKTGKYYLLFKAIKRNGFAMYATDSIFYIAPPKAKFSTSGAPGCQYISYRFIDSSFADTVSSAGYIYNWDFGDGNSYIVNSKTRIDTFNHIYNVSGAFTVRLIFSNGFCTDTFSIINNVNILPAPKSGFTLNSHNGCLPFTLNIKDTLTTNVSKKEYDFGNGFVLVNSRKAFDTSIVLNNSGKHILLQRLTGITGCITESRDSLFLKTGLKTSDTIDILYTTVVDSNTTFTKWKSLPNAINYTINGTSTPDTFFIDKNVQPYLVSLSYTVVANDSCGNRNVVSPMAKTIYLKGENINSNAYALLKYTPYETWRNGVLEYEVEFFNKAANTWTNLNTLPGNVLTAQSQILPDSENISIYGPQICYRVKATEQNGNKQISISNVICLPIYPVVFIPNAFSPNGDGLNDYFKPVTAGLNSYIFQIYDRWGQLVYEDSPESKGWDGTFRGKPIEEGVYVYRLSAIGYLKSSFTNDARVVERKGSLLLVR